MKKNPKFIFVSEDLGGFNSIEPVFKKLGGRIFSVKDKNLSDAEIENEIRDADIVVAGTSFAQDSLDKRFIRIAKKSGVKTVAILDFWTNYDARFKTALPDYILVMDEIAKDDLLKAAYPEEKIIVSGNPYFDKFKNIEQSGDSIVFFCQPFTELKKDLNLNEIEILKDFAEAFKKIGILKKIKVKLHPITKNINKFDNLDVEMSKKDVSTLIEEAEIVIGMNSMALFEAAMRGRKVLSYQPGLNAPDPLVTNRLGITKAVYKKEELENAIKEVFSKAKMANNYKMVQNATQEVINILKKL